MAGWRIRLFTFLAIAPWLAASSGAAEEQARFDWHGLYVGVHGGGALSLVDVADAYGPSVFGDTVRAPGPLAGGQLGYNWQRGTIVYGLEADLSWADLDGTNTCLAYSGNFVSSNCVAHVNAIATVAGRLGWALPFDGRTLVYGKAGVATAHTQTDATPGGGMGLVGTGASNWLWGWMLGVGVEQAIWPHWSVKAEYDYLAFGDVGFTAPASQVQTAGLLTSTPSAGTDLSQDIHLFKIGLNYRLGAGETPAGGAARSLPERRGSAKGTEFKAGVRYVHGWAQFHKDLGIMGMGVASPVSRLTYDSPGVDGAEGFARIDTSFGLMAKGLFGGATGRGKLNDEDWGLPFLVFVPYSNTLSSVDDRIRYWTIDVGYSGWRSATYTIAPFIGYSRLQQDLKGFGCRQIANPSSDCNPPLPTSVLGITEDDAWHALRLGTAVDIVLAPRLTLSGEAAYLPYVRFSGTDNHVLRSLVSPETGDGLGVQVEAMLSYDVTDALSVGIGGRYWSMWTTSGDTNFGGMGLFVPTRYAAEQAHLLVQASYKFSTTGQWR